MPSIELKGIRKSYGSIRAADGLDLEVRSGEYLCLLGPTGAGKTTTLRVLAGLIKPDSGTVTFEGKDMARVEPEDRKAVLLSQTYSLFPQLTVAENILFGPEINRETEDQKTRTLSDMLDMVRLTTRADAYPRELSGGMQQRTALARALASGADTLLLDEPLRALDARLRISLRYELRSLAKALDITTVHVTHDQDEALVMADRIAVIRDGKILQIGTPGEVFDHPNSPFIANFVGQSNFFVGKVTQKRESTRVSDGNLAVEARPSDIELGADAVVGIKVGNTEIFKDQPGFFSGTVERILFEGRNLHVDVTVEGIGHFSAKVPSWRMGKIAVGDRVNVKWNWDKATVFRMPDKGLPEELKVE